MSPFAPPTAFHYALRRTPSSLAALVLSCLLSSACERTAASTSGHPDRREPATVDGLVLHLGDIEPDEPAHRLRRFAPLTDLLEQRLRPLGVASVKTVIARDLDEMGRLLASGGVDVYMDSVYPTLAVESATPVEIALERRIQNDEYRSLIVATASSGIRQLEQLPGHIVALQDPHSTAGYFLPIKSLEQHASRVEEVNGLGEPIRGDTIGYLMTGDEENVVQLLRSGDVVAGALSSEHYAILPAEIRSDLVVVARSEAMPRQLVSLRQALDDELRAAVVRVLLEIDDQDRARLEAADPGEAWTWRFFHLDENSRASLSAVRAQIRGEAVTP